MKFQLYVAGCANGGTGPAGYGVLIAQGSEVKGTASGRSDQSTSARMALAAVARGLMAIRTPSDVTVFSPSSYIHNAIRERWFVKWKRYGWKKSVNGSQVQHCDLWEQIEKLAASHVRFTGSPIQTEEESRLYTQSLRMAQEAEGRK